MNQLLQEHHVQFFTAVCKDWLCLLAPDELKDMIIASLKFLIAHQKIKVAAYVIMPNHIHLIWRIGSNFKREDIQRDFLKFTAKNILLYWKQQNNAMFSKLKVFAKDRETQVWKRDSMSIDLYSPGFFEQKFNYIHSNPCQPKWRLAQHPVDYKYSSASYYETGKDEFDFLTHYHDI